MSTKTTPPGWTLVSEGDPPFFPAQISCNICGAIFAWTFGQRQDELAAHRVEHAKPEPAPRDPFADMDREALATFLQATPVANVDRSVRQALLDRCKDLGIQMPTYAGWINGRVSP